MTPQELKASILQLAIQGKLVEQRSEEGTGEELYKQIRAEKQELIKLKKIKKDKPLPEITEDEIPFDIPNTWKWVRIQDLFNVKSAMRIHQTDWKTNGIPFFRGRELVQLVNTGNVDFDIYISRELYEANKAKGGVPQKDDLLISAVGTLGKVYVVKGTKEFYYKDAYILCLENIGKMFPHYIKFALESPYSQAEIRRDSMATTVAQLTIIKAKGLLIPLPPVEEQKRIVAKLQEILPLIDRYEQAWSKLEEFNKKFPVDMQKSVLQMAIQGKLVEQRTEEGTGEELFQQIQTEKQQQIKCGALRKTKALPEITEDQLPGTFPDSWKICYIDDIAFVTKLAGFEYSNVIASNLSTSGIPLFKGKNVQNGKLVLEFESYIPEKVSDELPRSQILKRCLLTPYVGTIGNIAVFDGSFKAHLGSNVGKIELLNGEEQYVLEEYVLYYLRSDIGYRELTKYKKATAQESISIDAIRNVIIAIPPLAEQKRIVQKLEEILPLCERLK